VDTGLDENEAELGVLVLAVAFKMLAHRDGLFDELVKVFWNFRSKTVASKNAKNLVSCYNLDLCNSMRITENYTDLRGSVTLLCELANLVLDLIWGSLEPVWSSSAVGNGRGRNALAVAVHATHIGGF